MRRFSLIAIVIALFVSAVGANAAPPPAGPPGLATAIAAQEKHNPRLLTTPGVVGTAVGLGEDGTAVVRVFVERRGMGRLPASVDGVPVSVQVTGKLTALKKLPPRKQNAAPVVDISSPLDGDRFDTADSVTFAASALDREEGDLSSGLVWTSSTDGPLGTGTGFARSLSTGTHTITASATDSRLLSGEDSVAVTVDPAPVPPTTGFWPRPVPIGVSTGNAGDVSAGTIACRVVDAAGNVYALSNAHVFAPNDIDGQGEIGDVVTQPGLYDVPTHAYDPSLRLGVVSAYKPIDGSIFARNDIDAAIAVTDGSTLDTTTPAALGGYGVPNSVTRAAAVDMAVQKSGRSTSLTKGTITGINATMVVGYADDWYALFTGQIIVESPGGFIQPGDSGSLMVTDDADANPVGLLFAGNAEGTMAIANPIDDVLQHFDVTIDGK